LLLHDQVFLVTGAAGDLAASVIQVFQAQGARLALTGHSPAELETRARAWGVPGWPAELTDPEQVNGLVNQVIAELGQLDGVLHLAGGFAAGPLAEADQRTYQQLFQRNVESLFVVMRATLPLMLKQGHGFLAGVSAGHGYRGEAAGAGIYAAAKSAVSALLRSAALEAAPQGVRVAVLYPMGTIDTEGNRRAMPNADFSHWIDPKSLAEALLFAATRPTNGRVVEIPIYP
jgi:NADP-dependent 3-hydroxy acid dehydrogenase YdfG